MQWTAVKSNWPAFIEAIMQRWPATSENELLALDGDRERLANHIAEAEGLEPQEAERQVAEWLQGAVPADVAMDETRDSENIRASAAHIPVGEDVYSDDKDFGSEQATPRPVGRDS